MVTSRVRQYRLAAGLSQQSLAERAGVARQAVHAIETGRYLPNTLVALRLAQALACTVEALFALPEPARLSAELPEEEGYSADLAQRVQLAQVGGRTLAYPMRGSVGTLNAADGLARGTGRSVAVELLVERRLVGQTVVVGGCDPALALLGVHLSRRDPALRLIWRQGSSRTALRSLARGEVHAAGIHMHEPGHGAGNLEYVARELPGQPVTIVGLCDWQQGLLLAAGNPQAIRRAADLARRGIRVVNREAGAGSRLLFDSWLASDGIVGSRIAGYERELTSHLAIGEAVAAGAADAGPGILSVARALDLDFLALQEEPYDLVVPLAAMRSAAMQAMLEVAVSEPYRRELAALGGYDTRRSGTIVARLGA
jgi:putative molybdopterin biosynthesis protein